MQIVDDKALLFVTKKADQIVSLIPKSKIVERNGDKARVLVNWGEDEAKILRNLRIKDVPHPILGKYKWPGMFTPFAHQKTTSAFLATHPRAFVFNSPGTGKSATAAWAADYLMERGAVKRVLVICPVSIMDTAWRADLFRTLMHRTVAIASGDRRRRIKVIEGDYDFVIINYDGVSVVQKELIEGGFDLVICDEASALKSVQTDRWKSVGTPHPHDPALAHDGHPRIAVAVRRIRTRQARQPFICPQFPRPLQGLGDDQGHAISVGTAPRGAGDRVPDLAACDSLHQGGVPRPA